VTAQLGTTKLFLLYGLAALALAIGGCGDDDDAGGGDAGEVTAISVAETAGVPSAFLSYGVEQGIFRKHGLDVKVQTGAGGAAAIPSVVSGDNQFAGSNVVSVILAANKGLPIKVIAPGTFASEDAEQDFSGLMVRDREIESAQELEGTKMAVNTVKNVAELLGREAVARTGADPSTLRMTEVDFPEMQDVLAQGDVASAFLIEPFVTAAQAAGQEVLLRPYTTIKPGLQVGSYVTTESYIEENEEIVDDFAVAQAETARAVEQNEQDFREFLQREAKLPAEAAKNINLPVWKAESDPASIELYGELMVKYGLTDKQPPEDLIRETGES
jgi:NitT/TauT family transport system substrate-binding protein